MLKKIDREKVNIISFVLMVSIMILIFCFSHQPGDDSAELSKGVLAWILDVFGLFLPKIIVSFLKHWIRKVAHFTIYLMLGFFSRLAFPRLKWWQVYLIPVIYAISDEIHQIFIPGRDCRIFDIGIDSIGAIIGLIIASCLYRIMKSKRMKRI